MFREKLPTDGTGPVRVSDSCEVRAWASVGADIYFAIGGVWANRGIWASEAPDFCDAVPHARAFLARARFKTHVGQRVSDRSWMAGVIDPVGNARELPEGLALVPSIECPASRHGPVSSQAPSRPPPCRAAVAAGRGVTMMVLRGTGPPMARRHEADECEHCAFRNAEFVYPDGHGEPIGKWCAHPTQEYEPEGVEVEALF